MYRSNVATIDSLLKKLFNYLIVMPSIFMHLKGIFMFEFEIKNGIFIRKRDNFHNMGSS